MDTLTAPQPVDSTTGFIDRRRTADVTRPDGPERRQFRDSRVTGNPLAIELAEAIDSYKLTHRRRFVTYEELYDVIAGLGYRKIDG